jgi:diguanylate cyclase (GGDEF)-like protein/putative nucleotidyltransferase with HDIG domain
MIQKQTSSFQRRIIEFSLAYAVFFIGMLLFHPGSEAFYKAFQNFYQAVPPLFAGICGIAYATQGRGLSQARRAGRLLIGVGSLIWGMGQCAWTYYESIRGVEMPYPGPADIGYLGAIPLLIVGVSLLCGRMATAGRLRLLLDSAIVTSSVGILSWYFLVARLWQQSDTTLLSKIIGVAYPLGDVVILFFALVLLKGTGGDRNPSSLRGSFAFLAGGMVLLAFADTLFALYTLNDAYHTGIWFDWGFSFGWMLIGWASLLPLWWPDQRTETETAEADAADAPAPAVKIAQASAAKPLLLSISKWANVLLPYIGATVALSIVAVNDYGLVTPAKPAGLISNSVLIAGLMLILLVVMRQVLTLVENINLTDQLRSFNSSLEQIVTRRTRQLMELHQLTKAINNTLVRDQVLAAAAKHTRQALQADAVVIRLVEGGALNTQADIKAASELNPDSEQRVGVYLHEGLEDRPDVLEYITARPLPETLAILPLPAVFGDSSLNGSSDSPAPPAKSQQAGCWMRAPLLWQSRTIGSIGAIRWNDGFEGTEPALLESIGVEVGTALANAREYAAAVEAADCDPVTGLLNHRAIHQRLDVQVERALSQTIPLTIIMMDLNNFKLFNDTYGHPVGDQVLKRVAEVLRAECRKTDLLGRYGGDEFLIVLPETEDTDALEMAQRLSGRMAREGFRRAEDRERTIPVTLSFGIAAYPKDSTNRHELLTIADSNLYNAKSSDTGISGSTESQRTNRRLRTEGSFDVLDAMVTAVDNKDRYTRRHSEDVTEYALWIAEEMGLSQDTMRLIRIGGLLHDVGKIGVPEDILRKPGRLTAEEYEVMKRHPQLGALIVAGVPGMEDIVDIVRSHHERWDGHGYPDELYREDIPLLGRLLAVADAFSAMTTARPYRKGLDWDSALDEIQANIGTQFDPDMARTFMRAVSKRQQIKRQQIQTANGVNGANGKQGALTPVDDGLGIADRLLSEVFAVGNEKA